LPPKKIRAADAKEVGMRNPAEETFCPPESNPYSSATVIAAATVFLSMPDSTTNASLCLHVATLTWGRCVSGAASLLPAMPRLFGSSWRSLRKNIDASHFQSFLRTCLKIARGAAARDFGCGQGGEGVSTRAGASPQRADCVARSARLLWASDLQGLGSQTTEPTPAPGTRPAARRVFEGKAVWLCCSSVGDPPRIFSNARAEALAPRHPVFPSKTSPRGIFRQALRLKTRDGRHFDPGFPHGLVPP